MRRVLIPLIIFLSVAVAGCQGQGDATRTDDARSGTGPWLVPSVETVVSPHVTAWEPTLGVGPDGTLYTYGHVDSALTTRGVLNWQVVQVLRSVDGGSNWDPVGVPHEILPDFDPYLSVDDDGAIWFPQMSAPGGCMSVAVSRDRGESWMLNPAVCRGPVYDRPYIVPLSGGVAYLYYLQNPGETVALRTTDHGVTWTPTGMVHPFPERATGWSGGGMWNRVTGSVYFMFPVSSTGVPLQAVDSETLPGFAVTRDDGASFTLGAFPAPGWADGGTPDVLVDGAVDEEGNVYAVWVDDLEDPWHVYLAWSDDDGRAWSDPIRITDGNGTRVFPTVAAGAAGAVAVAYYVADEAGHPEALSEEAAWKVGLTVIGGADTVTPVLRQGYLSEGRVLEGPLCVTGNGCNEIRELGDFFDIDRLSDGRIGAVWTDAVRDEEHPRLVYAGTKDPLLP